jgi:hypothetical protein
MLGTCVELVWANVGLQTQHRAGCTNADQRAVLLRTCSNEDFSIRSQSIAELQKQLAQRLSLQHTQTSGLAAPLCVSVIYARASPTRA